jgi:DNA-binding transcriptional LysR family regulator
MDRFQEMQIFATVAQEQGFSAAARRLGLSAASVTRAVAALEQRIGTQLLIRTTRSVHLSEAGQRYLEDCRRILAEVQEAEDSAAGSHAQPRGQLTVTAPVLFGELFVTPLMATYLTQYPDVSINALLVDRVVSMVEEGIDVAVRIGELPDSNQHAIRVGEVRRVICASPAYLARYGRPSIHRRWPARRWWRPRPSASCAVGRLWTRAKRSACGLNRGWWSPLIRRRLLRLAWAWG